MTNTDELIIYSNSRNGLGIRILGSKRATNKSGIFIKQLLDDGLAQRDGRLKVGDQILAINDEPAIGISREHAVNLLRSAAATNQVRLRVRHSHPPLSSTEYQKYLYEEKSTDDDEDFYRQHNTSQPKLITNELRTKKSSRRHHHHHRQEQNSPDENPSRSNPQNISYGNHRDENLDRTTAKQSTFPPSALQSILNSKFKSIDLVDLLKTTYPTLLSNESKLESQFLEHVSQINSDGRITLKDFERQASLFFGGQINLLNSFLPSSSSSSMSMTSPQSTDDPLIVELRRELVACRRTIEDLENKIVTCEKSQRLANEIELEYEDLLKFLYEQLNQLRINETNQLKQLRANDQLIQNLFSHLSSYVNKPTDEHILAQLKFEYEQQQKHLLSGYQLNSSRMNNTSNNKS